MNETALQLTRARQASLAVGMAGLLACGLGLFRDSRALPVSYLFAFLFWTSLSLGCFYAAMIHYLTAGRWGFPARRFFEAGFMTLPVMAVLFIPVFFGLHELYPWARPGDVSADLVLQQRAAWSNPAAFILRAVLYFGIWTAIAVRLRKWSLEQDATDDPAPTLKIRALSGPAVAIVPLTASFAFVDWAMSVEARWTSTIFPVIFLSGQVLLAFAFAIVLLALFRDKIPPGDRTEKTFRDLGSLLLAFVMFWTYVAFSQFLIIYSANLPREIGWYLRRTAGGWGWVAGAMLLFHFFLPFFLLLSRRIKQDIRALAAIAALVFAVHAGETFWVVAPAFYPRFQVHWTDVAAWFGIGGVWLAVFCGRLGNHPLLARNDPRWEAPRGKGPVEEVAHAR